MDISSLESSEASIPEIFSVSEMTPEHAAMSMARKTTGSVDTKTLKDRHHRAAKLIAAGFKNADVARKTGYAVSTIKVLKGNPAFKDLVEHYSTEFSESVDELHDKMEALTVDLLEEITTRLESDTAGKDISMAELKELLTSMLDRTGRGPIKKIEKNTRSMNVSIIQRVRKIADGQRFDSVEEKPPASLSMPTARRLGVGQDDNEESLGAEPEAQRPTG